MKQFLKPTFLKVILFLLIFSGTIVYTFYQSARWYGAEPLSAGWPFNFVVYKTLCSNRNYTDQNGNLVVEMCSPPLPYSYNINYFILAGDIALLYLLSCAGVAFRNRIKKHADTS